MTNDQLSPPVNLEFSKNKNVEQWKDATEERIISLVKKLDIKAGDVVVDLGSGIGGPARLVEKEFSAKIIQVNISHSQLISARDLSETKENKKIIGLNADMAILPLANNSLDAAYSINAMYHVENIDAVFAEISRTLKPLGRIGIDDWFTTKSISSKSLKNIRNHWSTPPQGFHQYDNFLRKAKLHGLRILEETDFTRNAGEFFSEEQFGNIYDEQLKIKIIKMFPKLYQYQSYESGHAVAAAEQLREAILKMGELYRNGQAVYKQIVMQKVF